MYFGWLTIEIILGFIALFTVTKLLGKTQISQLTLFDFISALVLGELLGNALYDKQVDIFTILYAIGLWGALIYLVKWSTLKFAFTRGLFIGYPTIIIQRGELIYSQLKRNKIDINQVQALLRKKDVFSIREVEYALLEADGSLTVLKKSEYTKPDRNDLNISHKAVNLPISVIVDGKVAWDNLKAAGHNEKWLKQQLSGWSVKSPNEVCFAEWLEGKGMYLVKYDDKSFKSKNFK